MTIQSVDGNASPVVYDSPSLIAGEPPITTTCSPPSGGIFLLGVSTVTCTATDAARRVASCSFTVTVAKPPQLLMTRFMAFGNSITEGKDAFGTIPNTYPVNLKALLDGRYVTQAQALQVINKGFGGEQTPAGRARLPRELDTVHPDVLLLEEGVNDLSDGDPSAIPPMIDNLRSMVLEAKRRGISVFIATLTPVRAGGMPFPRGDGALPLIGEANRQIRLLAQNERVTLVDLFEGFGGSPDPYIDVDGLHPNAAGYQKIAQLFFDMIRATLELPQTASAMELADNVPIGHLPLARLH